MDAVVVTQADDLSEIDVEADRLSQCRSDKITLPR